MSCSKVTSNYCCSIVSVCSICIRKYMLYKTNCPSCFAETVETQLKFNRTIDNIIIILKRLKEPLCEALQITNHNNILSKSGNNKSTVNSPSNTQAKANNPHNIQLSPVINTTPKPPSEKPAAKSLFPCSSPKPPTHSPRASNFVTSLNSSFVDKSCVTSPTPHRHMISMSPSVSSPLTSPSTAGSSEVANKTAPKSVIQMLMSPGKKATTSTQVVPSTPKHHGTQRQNNAQATVSDVPKVTCPVCNVDIPQRYINTHLDTCLKNSQQPTEEK